MIFPSIDLASTEQKSERKPADDDEMVVSPSEKLANSITATVAWPNGLDLEEPLTEPGENKQPEVEESCTGRNDVLLREMRNFHIRNDRNWIFHRSLCVSSRVTTPRQTIFHNSMESFDMGVTHQKPLCSYLLSIFRFVPCRRVSTPNFTPPTLVDTEIRLFFDLKKRLVLLSRSPKDWISKNGETRVSLFLTKSFYAKFHAYNCSRYRDIEYSLRKARTASFFNSLKGYFWTGSSCAEFHVANSSNSWGIIDL